ncbi:cell division protein FtsQ [Candidatus Electrothrix communis]|uniref:Cell division protein FtsQ n=1 Tax=Candidatus Electrothrix communis TaxID=1859133 RepID=A0A3S3RTD5_9BACT|nr:cell division protein FtsQ [Candidatus Electrothrix communis]
MARKKIRYRRQSAGRSPMLRQFRSNYIRPPAQLRIRVNMGRYQQSTSVTHKPEWNLQLIRKSLLLLVLVMLSVGAGRWGVQTLERSGVFSVRRVTVEGNRMSNEAQIRTLAEIKQGDQLFSVISEEVIERVRQHPWVDQVEVERVWPDTLTIRVHEYRPLAMINIEGKQQGLYYLDHHGIVFAPVESLQDIDYPVITGFAPPDGSGEVPGLDLAEGAMVEDVCDFLHVAARGNPILPLQSISEIHINREKGIIVYLVEHPFPIYVGYGNIEKRYYQLVKLLERFYRKKRIEGIEEIRMDYHESRILVARSEP